MESWNSVINTALLGTEKKTLRREELDAALAESIDLITQRTTGGEEMFLQTAALVYNYRQCGFVPVKKESLSLPVAEAEERPYTSSIAHAVLKDVVDSGSPSLLQLWLEQCAANNKLVQPDFLPLLLTTAVKQKGLQSLVKTVGGKRGEWLMQFNEDWTWAETVTDEELWQTGSLPQRKAVLAQMRKINATAAREALQQTWPQENAAAKEALLEEMGVNAGDEDVTWLESLLNEKSAKVKEAALKVLKSIPSSAIIQDYWTILKQSIRLTTSKGLLGIGSKTMLEMKLADVDPSVFKTGIEAVSNDKKISDDVFIFQQLIAAVPPHFWEEYFSLDKRKIIELSLKEKEAKVYASAFATAAASFKDVAWMKELIDIDKHEFYPRAFKILSQPEAEKYALRFLQSASEAETIIQYLSSFPGEWSHDFAAAVLPHLARFPHHFHRSFYNENVLYFPVSLIPLIDTIKVADKYGQQLWDNTGEHLKQFLILKQKILTAFSKQDKR